MDEIKPGIHRWTAPHPDWEPGAEWDQTVASYAIDANQELVIIDPLAPPPQLAAFISSRKVSIVLTCPWHRRDAVTLAEQLGATLYVPPPDEADPDPVPGTVYQAGDPLPLGIQAFPGMEPQDLVLWISSVGAVVCGDTLIERDGKLVIPIDWVTERGVTAEAVIAGLRALLDLPVQIVLPTHGSPCLPDALQALLA